MISTFRLPHEVFIPSSEPRPGDAQNITVYRGDLPTVMLRDPYLGCQPLSSNYRNVRAHGLVVPSGLARLWMGFSLMDEDIPPVLLQVVCLDSVDAPGVTYITMYVSSDLSGHQP